MPGPEIRRGCARLSQAYDRAVLTADPRDVSIRSSSRVHDFVNRGPEFDGLYVYRPVLGACCRVIGRPFKLSTMLARTLEPGTRAQPLHVDVKRGADGWPLVGFIVMVDEFDAENGATRFVPGSHLLPSESDEWMEDATDDAYEEQVLACGTAGSIIIRVEGSSRKIERGARGRRILGSRAPSLRYWLWSRMARMARITGLSSAGAGAWVVVVGSPRYFLTQLYCSQPLSW